MGIEYYLLKPDKRETFYLGKHFTGFGGIPSATYKSIKDASYPDYEDWDEFFWDTLKTNWSYFLNCDILLDQISDVIHEIYEWCCSNRVILDHDCSDTASIWREWKETGDISAILEKIHNPLKDLNASVKGYLQENNSIIFDNPSFNSSIIGVSTDGRVVYDYNKMIKELSEKSNMSIEEAAEFIEYNTIGSLPSPSPYFPIVIYKSEDII